MEKVQTGQVIEFYSNSCLVKTNLGEFNCIAIKNIVVGDFVQLEIIQDSKKPLGKITKVNKRSSVLSRRDGNKNKLFAANVTHVGILVTPNPKTTTEFIDKWILKTKLSNIEPFILNNKIDVESDQEYINKIKIYRDINFNIINISAKYDENLDELINFIKNKCVLFVGNSGAGKSTLTSKIIGKELKTNELSNDQGVHTTSISSLYELTDNAKVIDSPGMRDIELLDYSRENIINGFEEIFELSKNCKFNDCNHINNQGCKVIEGLANGVISKSRYNNFIKFRDSI
ncbi:MAG: ribosome small subunit-dependent GTPase A [SAR86 cluster bacterium]|jgi:ribosome biogenesis GTPase|uniref:Ribosome small subunit-dependent GTPase A n=1 Tax=SAR86 cluster bacterium TaxID=2030880 RepID=A0A520MWA1_9GAMM|nr:MAG: ribosome small subunit-dependent GTPase A [SAR86 cluster bacterium]|tara:strand:+ start:814 stop:1674 length:861 start_codon:yes stop_codon:yes gene_type:complete